MNLTFWFLFILSKLLLLIYIFYCRKSSKISFVHEMYHIYENKTKNTIFLFTFLFTFLFSFYRKDPLWDFFFFFDMIALIRSDRCFANYQSQIPIQCFSQPCRYVIQIDKHSYHGYSRIHLTRIFVTYGLIFYIYIYNTKGYHKNTILK